jgi:hypothetical protein
MRASPAMRLDRSANDVATILERCRAVIMAKICDPRTSMIWSIFLCSTEPG